MKEKQVQQQTPMKKEVVTGNMSVVISLQDLSTCKVSF